MPSNFLCHASTALILDFAATLATFPAHAQMLDKLKSETSKLVAPITGSTDKRLEQVAKFDHQVTGVTVSQDGRIFVNFPRWSEDVPVSVAEMARSSPIRTRNGIPGVTRA